MIWSGIKAQTQSKKFDFGKYEYTGTAIEQAQFLLRNNFMGQVDNVGAKLPNGLLNKIGIGVNIEKKALEKYLIDNGIQPKDIGGSLNNDLSYISHRGQKKIAKYFVIHDVSYPSYKYVFPANIDSPSWNYNILMSWKDTVSHIYITRTGHSKTMVDLSKGYRATKFESKVLGRKSKGLFIHVELVQPRVYPPGTYKTAPLAPTPAFTVQQYRRLALIYLAASFRKGEWMIPAYHACIDEGLSDGHDDPQKFNLQMFSDLLDEILNNLNQLSNDKT